MTTGSSAVARRPARLKDALTCATGTGWATGIIGANCASSSIPNITGESSATAKNAAGNPGPCRSLKGHGLESAAEMEGPMGFLRLRPQVLQKRRISGYGLQKATAYICRNAEVLRLRP